MRTNFLKSLTIALFATFFLAKGTVFAQLQAPATSPAQSDFERMRNAIYAEFGTPPTDAEIAKDLNDYAEQMKRRFEEERKKAKENPPKADLPPKANIPEKVDAPTPVSEEAIAKAAKSIDGVLGKISSFNSKTNVYEKVSLNMQFGNLRNQGSAGSCATFATVAGLEAAHFRQTGQQIDLSEMWIIRSLIGEKIGAYGPRSHSSYYLGTFPDESLRLIKRHGICSENSFAYDSTRADEFEVYKGSKTADKNFERFVKDFASYLKLQNDPKIQKCQQEAASFKSEISGFVSGEGSSMIDRTLHLLSFGIPLFIGVDNFDPRGGAHAVTITGYDRKAKFFLIRNSWGYGAAPQPLGFNVFDGTNRFGRGISMSGGLQFFATPKDIERACRNPEFAPVELLSFCPKN